jgi:phosphonate transport system substrate-binding protein
MRLHLIPALLSLFLGGCGEQSEESPADAVLRFSAIPDHNTTELIEKYRPVADQLGRALGIKVEYVPSRDYGASVEMFKNGDIHLAWFGGLTGVQARAAVDGARAIAQGAEDPEYYSYFIAHKEVALERSDSFPTAIADLKFTFGSEKSTSGRLMPEYFIRKNSGQGPGEFFSKPYGFSGAHDKTVAQVNAGTYQVGACNYGTYDKLKAAGKADDTKIIWKTPVYADYNFTAHPELETMFGAGFTDKLQAALLALDPELVRSSFSRSKMIPATNSDFAKIADTARELELLR